MFKLLVAKYNKYISFLLYVLQSWVFEVKMMNMVWLVRWTGFAAVIVVVATLLVPSAFCQSKMAGQSGSSLSSGKAKLAQGQYQEAVRLLEAAVKAAPTNSGAHLCLGQAYIKTREYTKARNQLVLAMRTGKGSHDSQMANNILLSLPKHVVAPRIGAESRKIAAKLDVFFRDRGVAVGGGAKPIVMDFYAPWAQPCKLMKPVIEKMKSDYGEQVNFVSINVDDPANEQVIDQYGVSPIPTLVFISPAGEVATYVIGYSGEQPVNSGIKKILSGG
ncbi:MAG: tetratricopeptide repeat protein [Candidatus Melainabacteria bacterium]|nr:tetratricopeptide repeat protein [Candidatus Melainabacteria bacterium]